MAERVRWVIRGLRSVQPDLVGAAARIGGLPDRRRRLLVTAMFVFAAAVIVASAEPFANSLITTGTQLGINKFLLVQWVAPLASEAPEFIVAIFNSSLRDAVTFFLLIVILAWRPLGLFEKPSREKV